MTAGSNKGSTAASPPATDIDSRPNTARTATPGDCNIAMRCVLRSNVDRFVKCFEDEEDQFHDRATEMVTERDEDGRSPLDMAGILGRVGMTKELITRGAEVNTATTNGYTALHYAAAWGKIQCLKTLVELEADLQLKTKNGERAREVALRYNQAECVDFLDWAEARQDLQAAVKFMRETLGDAEKVQGKLSREEKKSTEGLCNEKDHWIEATTDATTQDYINMKEEFQETCAPMWEKINEPLPEKEVKK